MDIISAVFTTEPRWSGSIKKSIIPDERDTQEASSATPPNAGASLEPTTPKAKTRRRSSQSKTSYHLAHPPPTVARKRRLKLHPRVLLQLQQASGGSRPIPVLDVHFASRLSYKNSTIPQRKQCLGLDDLVIVQTQTHESAPVAQSKLPRYAGKQRAADPALIAAICQSVPTESNGQCRTELRFNHNVTWRAVALSNGAYEFVSNSHDTVPSIARWVPKRDAGSGGNPTHTASNFKFSLIDTSSRRHPVIACMNRQSIDVYDQYTIPSNPQNYSHCTDDESIDSAISEFHPRSRDGERNQSCKLAIETDDALRTMIAVTGIWVAFCEGWSAHFRYRTTQVISDGISELSNRRRNSVKQPVSPAIGATSSPQQPEPKQQKTHRAIMSRAFSASSMPSYPSRDFSMDSSRRRVSTSTTIFGDDRIHHCAEPAIERRTIRIGVAEPAFAKGKDGIAAVREAPDYGCQDPKTPTAPITDVGSRDSVEEIEDQPTGKVSTLVQGRARRPGVFKDMMNYLRRNNHDR
ncbi:MAG: hypothetical protein Q9202_000972 [Teloschistes flavicans]